MTRYQARWGWRHDGKVQHLATHGKRSNQRATFCNRFWIDDHVLKDWTWSDIPESDRRPCLLCVGWVARNGTGNRALINWMMGQARLVRPDTPQPRYLEAV
jgi:hypothetical protein